MTLLRRVSVTVPGARAEQARAVMIELFPEGFEEIEGQWTRQAPLGWNTTDPEPVGRAVVSLLSDWWPATTGELIHVDGGYHAMGAPIK